MAKDMSTKPQKVNLSKNTINIIGDNVLFNNGVITAYYVLPLTNYTTATSERVEYSIDNLANLVKNLSSNNPELTFTIERIEKKIKRKDVLNNLYDGIKLYAEDYEMPVEFTKNVQDDIQAYCLLGIDIQQSNLSEFEDLSILATIKAILKQMVNNFSGMGNMTCDPEQILKKEKEYYSILKDSAVRASADLVFYNFVSKVYPCYDISYDKLSYVNENTYEDIMASITQTVSDNFGWFEMHNEGVDIFGLPQATTYGCMLDIQSFPSYINNVAFPFDYPNLVTTIQCIKKDKAQINIKRIQAQDKYELEMLDEAGGDETKAQQLVDNIGVAGSALRDIEKGEVICNFNASILVWAKTRDDLRQKIMNIVTQCKNRDIIVAKSLNQAVDYLDNYVNKKPKTFRHMTNIKFPLSFQQNNGATVGDVYEGPEDTWSPSIGEDVN